MAHLPYDVLELVLSYLLPCDLFRIGTVSQEWNASVRAVATTCSWKEKNKLALCAYPLAFSTLHFETAKDAFEALNAKDKINLRDLGVILTKIAKWRGANRLAYWGGPFTLRLSTLFAAYFYKCVRATQTTGGELVVFADDYSIRDNIFDMAKDLAKCPTVDTVRIFNYSYKEKKAFHPPKTTQIVTGYLRMYRGTLCGLQIKLHDQTLK
jgi:hypothetical protein